MKVAILIITFNRPNYLKETLWSLERADLSKVDEVLIVDNNSTEAETLNLIQPYKVIRQPISQGISANLLTGYEYLFERNDIVINFDSDAVMRPDCINKLLELYKPSTILTGFHSTTKNANGTERHIISSQHDGYCIKESVGGINFCIDKQAYENYVKPALIATNPHGNFDHISCINAGGVMCAVPSLVQHIGFESSLNHFENPDTADDFYYYDLPNVTLIGVDSNTERLQKSIDKCNQWIRFGDVVTLHPPITSKEEYSEYCIKELYKHVPTSHLLICQHDGFVNNFKAWDDSWLQYDYIGAPWWYNDGMDVGNGGFSLRSKRLMEIVANDTGIISKHPEDHVICRTYRKYLESKYGIKFAPVDVAEKFSFEGYRQPKKFLDKQFGVHGPNPRTAPEFVVRERYVVNQFQGLGDILFLVPLIRALIDEGNQVIWPIADHYYNIAKHFPDINMRRKSEIDIPYESRVMVNTPYGRLLPYRFAIENMGRNLTQCMQSKYELYGHNYLMWRELNYKRDYDNENRLKQVLNLPKKYQLVNVHFGEVARQGRIVAKPNPKLPIIEMLVIDGFSLIDWLGVIEGASEIHTANTSIMYLLELMQLDMPVYVYKRNTWGEVGFEHTAALWTNKAFIFET